jgi:hypothetical protein
MQSTASPEAELSSSLLGDVRRFIEDKVSLLLFGVGVAGNVLTLLTLGLSNLRKQSTSVFFCGLAAADSLALASYLCLDRAFFAPVCNYCAAFTSASSTCSAFVILLVTTERVLAVWRPLHIKTWATVARSAKLVAVAFLLAFAMYVPRIVLLSDVIPCAPELFFFKIYFWQVSSLLPMHNKSLGTRVWSN